ncbi:hypothetical protein TNCV_2342841 [Trichonephila clavipes]|nr:hypothetical protein TNCV_2342841 [Trichonephila clavipes]
MNKIRKTPAGLDCPTVSSEEFVAVDDDNVCTASQLWQTKTFWSLFKAPIPTSSEMMSIMKNSDEENKMKNVVPVPTPSEMRNVIKSMRSYLDMHPNSEMNNEMDDIQQFVAKNTMHRKVSDCLPKTQ